MAFVPAAPPASTKRSLRSRLITRTRERWPDLADLTIRHRGQWPSAAGGSSRLGCLERISMAQDGQAGWDRG